MRRERLLDRYDKLRSMLRTDETLKGARICVARPIGFRRAAHLPTL
jgi:hypothetical protein